MLHRSSNKNLPTEKGIEIYGIAVVRSINEFGDGTAVINKIYKTLSTPQCHAPPLKITLAYKYLRQLT